MAGLLNELLGRNAGHFAWVEPRRRAGAFVLGLLADLPRKTCWTLAEHAADHSPDGMQHLLARAVWDHDAVRDDARDYLIEHLGDPHEVLVVDETGDCKKGDHTVGVQRQYTGTAGKVDDAGGRRLSRRRQPARPWADGPGAVPAQGLECGCCPPAGGRRPSRQPPG